MKILHTADLHLGKTLNGYSLLEDQAYILNKIKDIIKEQNVDVVIFAGDIFDRAITSQEALDLFCDFLDFIDKTDKTLISILGNHDGERITFTNRILKKNNIYIIKEPTRIDIDNVSFGCIPYLNIHQFRDYYTEDFKTIDEAYKYALEEDIRPKDGKFNVMVAHDYFTYHMEKLLESDSEIKNLVGGLEYLDISMFDKYDYVALGHMHNPQRVGKDTIRYSGSILKYSFSEATHNKSIVLLDTDSNSFSLIPLTPKRDLVDIKGTVDELTNREFYARYNYNNDYFRAVLPKIEVDSYKRLKDIYPYLMEIQIESKDNIELIEKKKIREKDYIELFSMFYENMLNEQISDEELLIVKDYLLEGMK